MSSPARHRPRWPANRGAAAGLAAVLLLQACVVVPRTTEVYDRDCRVIRRQMVLDQQQAGGILHCGRDCAGLLVAYGVVAAASLVISGSIAVVGNMVYWFEEQGRCPGRDADTNADFARAAAASASAASSAPAAGMPRRAP